MRSSRLARLTAGAAILAHLGATPAAADFPGGSTRASRGYPAPGFTLKTLGGQSLSLARLRGNVVLLDFWGPT